MVTHAGSYDTTMAEQASTRRKRMNYTLLHIIGIVLVAGSLAYGAYLLGISPQWIGVVLTFITGMGLIGLAKSRGR